MFAAMGLAGYTASEADELRKAISKKKAEALLKHRQKFVEGAKEKGIPEDVASTIFVNWENFARYGFNKSHAADYGVIAVQTAYLKAHYTLEFMTALLSASKNEIEKIAWYIADSRMMGIDVLPPDVNNGGWDFTVEECDDCKSAIRFGLGAVKNVGQSPVELILEARGDRPFADLNDFAKRVDLTKVGKRSLEGMIKVGALDSFGSRRALLEALDMILSVSASHSSAKNSGQLSFFGTIEGVEESIVLPKVGNPDKSEILEWERELMGLYVSDHPLTPYLPLLKRWVSHFSGQLGEVDKKEKVVVAGVVKTIRNHFTKDGKPMAFITIEDVQGSIELLMFPRTWAQFGSLVDINMVITAEGKVDAEGKTPKVLVDQLKQVSLDEIAEFEENKDTSDTPQNNMDVKKLEQPSKTTGTSGEGLFELEPFDLDALPPQPPDFEDWVPHEEHLPVAPPVKNAPPNSISEPAPAKYSSKAAVVESPSTDVAVLEMQQDPIQILDEPPVSPVVPAVIQPIVNELPPPNGPRMMTVVIRATGEQNRDNRRLTQVHNLLCSSSGSDRFSFMVHEGGHRFLLDFPNETTGINNDLLNRLGEMVGEENINIEKLKT